ncbi:unnamed protein product [Trifolium pratense]|uniref:Uncharacterized protein n=1 Tax=Trifolium pratense TaxID=57577 RepID=A0ACB0KRH7_TRIPR|nr:unnamed protein product [Trifolium pratense]
MANKMLKLTIILSLLISQALFVSSNDDDINNHDMEEEEDDDEEQELYVVDTPLQNQRSRSRFLATIIKKGRQCNRETNNICNGVRANKGKDLLFCCKKHCRNILSDKNNCGVCGNKCKQGEKCCNGVCTNVMSNVHHCGKCKRECLNGDPCGNGFCGY